jgi:NAD(P)-dependent dehydrogenase (short-subunit alcohol dehydrogenase family)
LRLQDRVVLVTGAGGTIGREVSRLVAEHGARLAVTDMAAEPLEVLMGELRRSGSSVWGRSSDVADFEDFSALVAEVSDAFGPVQVLVNVAGTFRVVDFADSKPPEWAEMISANLLTAIVGCRSVLPAMIEARSGAIVNFASTAGEYGSIRPAAVYAAAKAGVIGFTKSLAREVSPMGVRVNAISPGPIDTPALKAVTDAERAVAASRTLVGRLGDPRDIAAGVLYLASDESAFVTGTVLQVNGGSLL